MRKWKLVLGTLLLAFSMAACGAQQEIKDGTDAAITQGIQEGEKTQETEKDTEPTKAPEPTKTPAETPSPEESYSLKDLFAEYGIKAGTCLTSHMTNNKACLKVIEQNFNSITFENDLKPDYILDQKKSQAADDLVVQFNESTMKLLDWCKENDMAVRGHTLIWHSQTPSWIFYEGFDTKNALVGREVMLARMESYISQVFALLESLGYSDMFYAYDVVNEAWMEDGTKRDSLWLTTIGDDYLWQAFYFADKYAPEHIELYYNDYNEQYKTDTLYDFVQTLVDEEGNYLIDGIGFQAHLYTKDNMDDYFATVDKLSSLGLKVCLTELDVCLGTWQNIDRATEDTLQEQGRYYYNLIGGLLERAEAGTLKTDSLTFWGFMDSLSWRKERSPLLYNQFYKPKYAYYGAVQVKEKAGFGE